MSSELKNPYKAVVGKFPTRKEMSEWTAPRWLDLLNFLAYLIETKPDKKGKNARERYVVNTEKMEEMESFLLVPNHPWAEYIYRVDRNLSDAYTPNNFYRRASAMGNICMTHLKRNPALVSEEMKAVIDTRPERMGWCLKQYFLKETPQGTVVQRDQMRPDGYSHEPVAMPSIQKKQMETLIEMVDLHGNLVKSIKKAHLDRDLTTAQKLAAIPKLVDAITKMASKKTGINHFTQINIHGGAREMEEQMLSYVKQKAVDGE